MLIDSIILAAIITFLIWLGRNTTKKKDKKHNVPVCYHCDAEDTLTYQYTVFSCKACGRVLDGAYIGHNWPEDTESIMRGEIMYERFKERRNGELEGEK